MGLIGRKRSPAVLIAVVGACVSAMALLALDAQGSDSPVTLSVAVAQPPGLGLGAAAAFGREQDPASTAVLASMRWTTFWPEPLVVLALLVGYAAAVLARDRLDPVRVPTRRL